MLKLNCEKVNFRFSKCEACTVPIYKKNENRHFHLILHSAHP